jgi:hypothetical protein
MPGLVGAKPDFLLLWMPFANNVFMSHLPLGLMTNFTIWRTAKVASKMLQELMFIRNFYFEQEDMRVLGEPDPPNILFSLFTLAFPGEPKKKPLKGLAERNISYAASRWYKACVSLEGSISSSNRRASQQAWYCQMMPNLSPRSACSCIARQ